MDRSELYSRMPALSKRIYDGNLDGIMEGFFSEGAIYRAQAIISVYNHRLMNDAIKRQLFRLSTDNNRVIGYAVSDFALAALNAFGIQKYEGDDPGIMSLIKATKWFE